MNVEVMDYAQICRVVSFLAGLGLLPMSRRAAVNAYVGEVEQAAAQLRRFMYMVQGVGLAGGPAIVAAAEGQTWTVKQFRVRGGILGRK